MKLAPRARFRRPSLLLLPALAVGAYSATAFSAAATGFEVLSFNVQPGQVWQLNRAIDVTFNADVDFSTVSSSTIEIRSTGDATASLPPNSSSGTPGELAVGTFELVSPQVVRFTPRCPTTLSPPDAGLQPLRFYTVHVPDGGVHSTANRPLSTTAAVNFRTPHSSNHSNLFFDTVAGPPAAVIRPQGSTDTEATYLELGLDDANRVYFEEDTQTQTVSLPAGFLAPINHYSRRENRVAWMIQLDQAVNPEAENLGPTRIGLEWKPSGGWWSPFPADVAVESNCTTTGAVLRVTPLGILPQDSKVRAVLEVGFEDLAGEARPVPQNVGLTPTRTSFNPGTHTQGDDGDQRFEGFLLSGDDAGSLEDTTTELPIPRAVWGGGDLTARFDFDGTGGPGGDFDWHIAVGTDFILDTSNTVIFGGPNGIPSSSQLVTDGIVDVRDLFVPASSRLIVEGPHPLVILASGNVLIEGTITVEGTPARPLETLNTTNIPEPGAPGNAGGGRGGTGSPLTTESTPRGGRGFGAFHAPGRGGQGGESCYAPGNKNNRRPGGGGGGRLGKDVLYEFANTLVLCHTLVGMDAEKGRGGSDLGTGAISQTVRAQGGDIGPSPFVDGDDGNDFFGTLIVDPGGPNERLVEGELPSVWAGAGGGAGGDAVKSASFPLVPFTTFGDEKGAGGGGGAGGLAIFAVGPIVVTDGGRVSANGGHGNGGENTSFFDRIGGGSGGGSGGHIVLSSGAYIEIEGAAKHNNVEIPFWYQDNPNQSFHHPRPVTALGGQGGAGNNNKGGAKETGPTIWRCDGVPPDHFEPGNPQPPRNDACWLTQPNASDELGPVFGGGGDGSPGIIQLHVPDPARNLRFTQLQLSGLPAYGSGLDVTPSLAPPPIGWTNPTDPTDNMTPFYGPLSIAQSKWISLGRARHNPGGPDDQVELFFGGLDSEGFVPTNASGDVVIEAPLLGPAVIQSAPMTPYIAPDLFTMVFDAASVSGFDDVYERNPELTHGFTLRLVQVPTPNAQRDFSVVTGSYDATLDQLSVTVNSLNGALTDFNPGGDIEASLIPRSFRTWAGVTPDFLDPDHTIRVTFDATLADSFGLPDDGQTYSNQQGGSWADVIDELNLMNWDFVRFRAEFDLDANGTGVDATKPRPRLGFLRVPDRF